MSELTRAEYLEIAKKRGIDINRKSSVKNDCIISFGILGQYMKVAKQLYESGDDIINIEQALGITLKEAQLHIDQLSQYIICAESYMKTL